MKKVHILESMGLLVLLAVCLCISAQAQVNPGGEVLPAPDGDPVFRSQADFYDTYDNLGADGSGTYDAATGTYEIAGSGADVWDVADMFHFLWVPIQGDFTLTARMEFDFSERSDSTNEWIKAMLMVRSNLTPGSANFASRVRRDGEFSWQARENQDGTSISQPGDERFLFEDWGYLENEWPLIRIQREGDEISLWWNDELYDGQWYQHGETQTIALGEVVFVGLGVTSHEAGTLQYTWFRDVVLEGEILDENKFQPSPEGDPIFSMQTDIYDTYENLGADGGATYDAASGTYEVWGSGTDVWNEADQFHYLWVPFNGDFVLTAKVQFDFSGRSTSTNEWIKAMLMARQSMDAGSPYFATRIRRDGQFSWQYRAEAAGAGSSTPEEQRATFSEMGYADDAWPAMRLTRSGDEFITEYLDEASNAWVQIGDPQTVALGDSIYIGLAVTAHDVGMLQYTWFRDVNLEAVAPDTSAQPAPEGDPVFDAHADIYDDIANYGPLGSAAYDEATGTYEISGSGIDVWNEADQFHFLWKELVGDFVLAGRLELDVSERSTSTDEWIKGMLMARDNLTPGAANIASRTRRDSQFSWQARVEQDGASTSQAAEERILFSDYGYMENEWPLQRLTREGDTFFVEYKDDLYDGNWYMLGEPQTIVMEDPIYVGLAVTSHLVDTIQYAWFRDVTLDYDPTSVANWMIIQ